MSYKKVIALANKFFIKASALEQEINDQPETNPAIKIEDKPTLQISQEHLTGPGESSDPEERKIAIKVSDYATNIYHSLTADSNHLDIIGYWKTHQKEFQAFNEIYNKYKELVPKAYISPRDFKADIIDFLNEKPKIILKDRINNVESKTQIDNLKIIYHDSYSDSIIRHQEMGLSGGKVLKPVHPSGIRQLLLFKIWMDENM